MSASIPTPFNFGRISADNDPFFGSLDNTDGGTLDDGGNDKTGATKTGGGLPSDQQGVVLNVIEKKAGFRYYFDSNTNHNSLNFTETGEKRIFVFAMQANATNRRQLGQVSSGGMSLKMYSGTDTTSEIREWFLGGQDTKLANRIGIFLFAIDPEANGSVLDIGNFDASDVLRYGHFINQSSMNGNASAYWFWCAAVLISSEKDSGGIPRIFGTNSSWQDLVDEVQGTTDFTAQNHLYVEKSGNKIDLFCPCSIGNASQTSPTQTTFNDSGLSINSPSSAETSDPRFHLTNDSMRVYLDLRDNSADTAEFSGTYNWGTQAPFDFSQSNDASITLSSANFTGMGEFTCGSSVSGNATFTLGGTNKVIINGANLDSSTINGDANVEGETVTTFTNLDVTGALDFDTVGTYTIDGGLLNEVTNSSGGNITLALLNGATVTTNTGPNITLNQFVNITAPNIIDGSRVQIYNVTKSSQLDNSVVSGGSGYSYEVNLLSNAVDIGDTIRLRATYQSGTTARKPLLLNSVITISGLIFIDSQENLAAYGSLGFDGSTVDEYNIDLNTGHLQIDADDTDCESTKKRLVAKYYYLITTEVGIERFFNAIILEDEANAVIDRSITSLMIDNIGTCTLNLTDNEFRLYTSDNSSWIQDPPTGGYGIISDSGKVYAVNQDQIETIVNAIKAKTDLFSFNTNNDVKATLDGEQVVASNMRGTDNANTTTPPTVSEVREGFNENDFKADVSSLATEANATANTNSIISKVNANESKLDIIDTNVDSILEDTNTTIPNQISGLNNISTAEVYAEFTSGNNEDAFKADVSGLATQVSIDDLNDLSTSDIDARLSNYGLPTLTQITSAFTEIKGTGWTVSDTLKAIKDELNNVGTSPSEIYNYFISGSNENAFKADVSSLATQSDVTTAKDEIIADNRLFQESDEYKTPTEVILTEKGDINNVLVRKTYTNNGSGTESLTESS